MRRYSTRFPTQWLTSTIAYLSKTITCSVDYLAYHGPEEAELSLWTGFMQEAASGLRRTPLLGTSVNKGKKKGRSLEKPRPSLPLSYRLGGAIDMR